ncbi:MAG: hypothetical protein R2794_11150 [Chitinophagales bacterium]
MNYLLGVYEVTMDAKQRIKVPAGLLSQLPQEDGGKLVVTIGVDKCLYLYPYSAFLKELDIISKIPDHIEENRRYKDVFFAGTHPVLIDSAQRILIPKLMLQHAGITKDMLLNCQGDKVVMWDTKTYNSYVQSISDSKSYQSLYEKVRGAGNNT